MKDLCAELDQRIAKLEEFRNKLQSRVSKGIAVAHNNEALSKVSNSLTYATQARQAMESSCCDMSCNYELQDQ